VEQVYLGTSNVPVDALPPRIIAVQTLPSSIGAGALPVVRYAVSDESTTDVGPRLSRTFARVTVDGGAPTEVEGRFMGGDLFRLTLPEQGMQGATVSFEVCAVDRQGNEGCSPMQSYVIEGTTGVGVGGGGQGGAGGGSAGGGLPNDEDELKVDDGCGCRTAGGPSAADAFWLALAAMGVGAARRRARSRR
jgi:MYXO-CTERM domain-containing protein